MDEKEHLYEKVQELREKVKYDERAMNYYEYLKELNLSRNGNLCSWMFSVDSILYDTLEDLNMYQDPYVRVLLRVYINELENILYKIEL